MRTWMRLAMKRLPTCRCADEGFQLPTGTDRRRNRTKPRTRIHCNESHQLVELDADSALGHVPHPPSAAVVHLVRHALVDSTVHLNVHIVADLRANTGVSSCRPSTL